MTITTHVVAPEYELHIRNGLEDLAAARSVIHELLYSVPDRFVRQQLLAALERAELNIRKALA